jgi:hypothetical protein
MPREPDRLEVLMLETFKEVLANQFHAALCTLSTCIDRCPDAA